MPMEPAISITSGAADRSCAHCGGPLALLSIPCPDRRPTAFTWLATACAVLHLAWVCPQCRAEDRLMNEGNNARREA